MNSKIKKIISIILVCEGSIVACKNTFLLFEYILFNFNKHCFSKFLQLKINLRGYPLWMDSPFDNVRDYLEALEVAITFVSLHKFLLQRTVDFNTLQ